MMIKKSVYSLLAGLLCVFVFAYWHYAAEKPHDVQLANGAKLQWTTCWFSWTWDWTRYPLCAYFYPSDAEQVVPHEVLKLPVVVLRQWAWARAGKPILYLAGGPGAPSYLHEVGMVYWQVFLEDSAWQGDWVLFDQRGTGLSRPNLNCPHLSQRTREIMRVSQSLREDMRDFNAAYAECYEYWLGQAVDLSAYNTERNAEDAVELMQALNQTLRSKRWNLFGVSYGTRLALQIMRKHSALLHSVILDSVYPPQHHALMEVPFVLQRALDNLLSTCREAVLCHWAYPNLETDFYDLLARVEQQALSFDVLDPQNAVPIQVKITAPRLIDVIFIALYRWDLIEQIPMIIDQAARGHSQELEPLVIAYMEMLLSSDFSDAMNMSVECYDMGDGFDAHSYQQQLALYPQVRPFVQDFWAYSPCRYWGEQRATAEFLKPVKSAVPTLLLAGHFDPVTPPQWAKTAAASLPRSQLVEFPDMGHAVIDGSQCAVEVAHAFLQNPNKTLENACLEDSSHVNFMLQKE